MSKLDDIFNEVSNINPDVVDSNDRNDFKQAVKALMLDLIGNSELAIANRPGQTNDNMARNGLRDELRQKVEEL